MTAKPEKNRKFYRSNENKMIAGVCGGIAEHFNIDSRLVRLLFVVFLLLNGVTLLLYVVMWILFPLAPVSVAGANESDEKGQ